MGQENTTTGRAFLNIRLLGLFTLVVFGLGGALLIGLVQHRDLVEVIFGPGDPWLQLILGGGVGMLMGIGAWALVSVPLLEGAMRPYAGRIGPYMGRWQDRLFISGCAGLGEELFFRGALQYWLGIPATAILFVAIHGYLDPRRWRMFIYGSVLTVFMWGVGWWGQRDGLCGPIAAHFMLDLVLLDRLRHTWERSVGAKRTSDQA